MLSLQFLIKQMEPQSKLKNFGKDQQIIDPTIIENQRIRTQIICKLCNQLNIMVNESKVYGSNQQNFPPQCLQYINNINNQEKIVQQQSVIINNDQNHDQNNFLIDQKVFQSCESCQSQQIDHLPPVVFNNIYVQSSSYSQQCQSQNSQENQKINNYKIFWLKQLTKINNFIRQFQQFHKGKLKQLNQILNTKLKTCSHQKLRSKQIQSSSKFTQPIFISNIQQLKKQQYKQRVRQKLQQNQIHFSKQNFNIRSQRSQSMIPTYKIKQQLSDNNLTSNLNFSHTYECLSTSNYLNHTNFIQSSAKKIISQEDQQFTYKSQNYKKRRWQLGQYLIQNKKDLQKQNSYNKQIKSFRIVAQNNDISYEKKAKNRNKAMISLKKLLCPLYQIENNCLYHHDDYRSSNKIGLNQYYEGQNPEKALNTDNNGFQVNECQIQKRNRLCLQQLALKDNKKNIKYPFFLNIHLRKK